MQTIKLHIFEISVTPTLFAKQGDVGRKFKAVITDGTEGYTIPAGAVLSVWFSGASGEGNYSSIGDRSAFTVSGNTVEVELITQMLKNKGQGALCLVMNSADGSQIGTWNIPYVVEEVPGMGSPAAEQYFTALTEAATKAADSAARAEAAAAALVVDTTLSVSGKAADAAATGEAISAVCLTATDDGTGIITLSYGGEVTPGGGFAVSPTIEVTEIDGGHTVTVTDVNGSQSFDVMDGKNGAPGADGKDGADGQPGADGYTPVKGTDYYTEADKQEMVDAVLAALPVETWTITYADGTVEEKGVVLT